MTGVSIEHLIWGGGATIHQLEDIVDVIIPAIL